MSIVLTAAAGAGAKAIGSSIADVSVRGLVSTVARAAASGANINSLADLSKPCRVEPITIIDKDIVHQPYMESLMKYGLSQFAGYYLQAVNMLMGVGKVNTLRVFDTLNPERTFGTIGDVVFSKEAYCKGLPTFSQESHNDYNRLIAHTISDGTASLENENKSAVSVSDSSRLLEVPNLAVGKLLNVKINDPETKKSADLPVVIRLVPAPIDSDVITHIFSAGGKQSWSHRLFLAKTGQIRFWRDFVMGADLIDAHFNALVKDKTGTYQEIHKRRTENTKKAIASGKVSMADASNIAIVSTDTIRKSSSALYGKIENAAVRKTIFDNSMLLMLMVVDNYHQRVTIYHRGLDVSTTHRLDEIESKEKGKGSDITEIFKLFSKQMQSNI